MSLKAILDTMLEAVLQYPDPDPAVFCLLVCFGARPQLASALDAQLSRWFQRDSAEGSEFLAQANIRPVWESLGPPSTPPLPR